MADFLSLGIQRFFHGPCVCDCVKTWNCESVVKCAFSALSHRLVKLLPSTPDLSCSVRACACVCLCVSVLAKSSSMKSPCRAAAGWLVLLLSSCCLGYVIATEWGKCGNGMCWAGGLAPSCDCGRRHWATALVTKHCDDRVEECRKKIQKKRKTSFLFYLAHPKIIIFSIPAHTKRFGSLLHPGCRCSSV